MISKGALERISDPGPGFYSRFLLVEKASGGCRPMIDLSPFNEFIQQTPFKMETASSVLLSLRKGDFLASYLFEGCLLPNTRPHLLQKMAPFGFGWDGSSIQNPMLRVIDCPAGLHQSLRDSVGLCPRPWGSSSQVPERLAGPGLYRGQSQTACPGPSVPMQLPMGSTQQRSPTSTRHSRWSISI